MTVSYEWDIERFDAESGDIIDHDHRDRLAEYAPDVLRSALRQDLDLRLVLVRDVGNDADGLTDRAWAYAKAGKLPEVFEDDQQHPTNTKVPKRFHAELALQQAGHTP